MIYNQPETLILKTNELTHRRWDQEPPGLSDVDVSDNFALRLIVGVPPSCGLRRHTGVVMECLMSTQN
jgi:hypothetical protein